MFGYVTVYKDELKIKDYNRYRAYYCGVCRSLKNSYGMAGQMTLTYDMTFLAILLSALYEDDTKIVMKKCIPHPVKKHPEISNEYTDYAPYIGWHLAIAYLKDYKKDRAMDILKEMEQMYTEGTAIGDKVRYLLKEI